MSISPNGTCLIYSGHIDRVKASDITF